MEDRSMSESKPTTTRHQKMHALLHQLTSSPASHDVLDLSLAVATSAPITEPDEDPLLWLIVEGVPGSDKTSTVLLLKDSKHVIYFDSVSAESLASGWVNEKDGKRAPDILKELDRKCLVIKELGAMLNGRPDKVRAALGTLAALHDRELSRATGTVGRTGGKAAFPMIACGTPATLSEHYRYMAKIGAKALTYRVPALDATTRAAGFDLLWSGGGKKKKLRHELRALVLQHVEELLTEPVALHAESDDIRRYVEALGQLVARSRTVLLRDGDWESAGEAQTEEPFRVVLQLRDLGRALARVRGRNAVSGDDVALVRRVALSSGPRRWAQVFALFVGDSAAMTAKQAGERIGRKEDSARKLLDELVMAQLLERVGVDAPPKAGRPAVAYRPVPELIPAFADSEFPSLTDKWEAPSPLSGGQFQSEIPVSQNTFLAPDLRAKLPIPISLAGVFAGLDRRKRP
jgi:hypothetical protein